MRRVPVHHPTLLRELSVPERRVPGLLRAGWQEGPLPPAGEKRTTRRNQPSKDDLLARAAELGVDVGKRWGVKRIAEAIAAHETAAADAPSDDEVAADMSPKGDDPYPPEEGDES